MKKRKIFRFLITLVVLSLACSSAFSVCAESIKDVPYTTYTYWEGYAAKTPVKTKATHKAVGTVEGNLLGIGAFSEIQHLVSHNDLLYVLDSGNGRVVVLNSDYKVEKRLKG